MSKLGDIPVVLAEHEGGFLGNTLPILHEIRHGLEHLAETREATVIDLSALPFGPDDEEQLLNLLGDGEVEALVQTLGPTKVRETGYPGVWIVDHYNTDQQRIALHVEIALIPQILQSQEQDIEAAINRLAAQLMLESQPSSDRPENTRSDHG